MEVNWCCSSQDIISSYLTGSQFIGGIAGKKWGDFLQEGGGCSCYIKNKPKSEIFNGI